ncbi:MAG TPA: EAL domain-containing protein [Thermoanaerobaculia bacterium]|jgi:EAL domain-containing protein (putative c-di-GMP-specific phosphodiesterase class I)
MREHRALNAILEPGGISSVYQPIMEVDGTARLAGFECLSRGPAGTNFESAKVMFEYVRLKREEILVDRACVAVALANAPRQEGLGLTVNVHASTLGRDEDFPDFVCATADANGIAHERLTVEIIEHAPPWDSTGFAVALRRLRDRGMCISLDDVGLGQSNFKMILDVRPDFLKLDRYFVESCPGDPNRQAVIECVATLATHFGAEVIAEGVDSPEVAETLRRFGVRFMQGYLFAAPMEAEKAKAFVWSGGG